MTFVVTENCIKCKYMDCVEVCPVDCFHEGPNFLVIDPDECIDCTLCEPECPVEAIFSEEELPAGQEQFTRTQQGTRPQVAGNYREGRSARPMPRNGRGNQKSSSSWSAEPTTSFLLSDLRCCDQLARRQVARDVVARWREDSRRAVNVEVERHLVLARDRRRSAVLCLDRFAALGARQGILRSAEHQTASAVFQASLPGPSRG